MFTVLKLHSSSLERLQEAQGETQVQTCPNQMLTPMAMLLDCEGNAKSHLVFVQR
jgi:hypothetical protein